jgi:hypothetical protein
MPARARMSAEKVVRQTRGTGVTCAEVRCARAKGTSSRGVAFAMRDDGVQDRAAGAGAGAVRASGRRVDARWPEGVEPSTYRLSAHCECAAVSSRALRDAADRHDGSRRRARRRVPRRRGLDGRRPIASVKEESQKQTDCALQVFAIVTSTVWSGRSSIRKRTDKNCWITWIFVRAWSLRHRQRKLPAPASANGISS